METKALQLSDVELKYASSSGKGQFKGYASTFGGVDTYNDMILPGAYTDVIKAIKAGTVRMPKMFFNHRRWEVPIGKWMDIAEDEKGLLTDGELTPKNPLADTIKAGMEHQTIDGLSIGYALMKGDYEFKYDEALDKTIRVIKRIAKLDEMSVVSFPADDPARIDLESVKSSLELITNIREFEEFLREAAGFSKGLAVATAGQVKRIFSQRESGEPLVLPDELQRQIAENLKSARTL